MKSEVSNALAILLVLKHIDDSIKCMDSWKIDISIRACVYIGKCETRHAFLIYSLTPFKTLQKEKHCLYCARTLY